MPAKTKTAPRSTLEEMLAKGLIKKGTDPELKVTWVSTGIPQLDEIMGGGVPRGRITHLSGEWSAGKTLVAQLIAAAFQQLGLTVALIDVEQSYDAEWWLSTGVNTDELIVAQPPGGEAAVDVIAALMGEVDLIILDSIAGLIPIVIQDKDADESVMGRHPLLVSRLYQKVLPKIGKSQTAFITINQVRSSFGPGNFDSLPGGRSQNFWSHIMLRLRRTGWIESAGQRTGFKMEVRCTKNKLDRAHRYIELPWGFDGQFDYINVLLTDAIARNIIRQMGPYYRMPASLPFDEETVSRARDSSEWQIMGRSALAELFEANAEAREHLESLTYNRDLEPLVKEDEADGPSEA